MAGEHLASHASTREELRTRALADLDLLMQVTAEARKDLRSYQSALEKNYRHLSKGGRASDMSGLFDVAAVRASFTDRLDAIEKARNRSRRSLWQLQLAEGMTIAQIARAWGFSRQLVSRALSSRDDPDRDR